MNKKPAYLIEAEADWEKVSHDPEADPLEMSFAEDALADARRDAEAEGYSPA